MIDREAIRARWSGKTAAADIAALLDALDEAERERDAERVVSVAGADRWLRAEAALAEVERSREEFEQGCVEANAYLQEQDVERYERAEARLEEATALLREALEIFVVHRTGEDAYEGQALRETLDKWRVFLGAEEQ